MTSTAFNNMVAQFAHFGWGALLVIILAAYISLPIAMLTVMGGAAIKESIESIWGVWEPIQPWKDGLYDWSFFTIGSCVAMLFLLSHPFGFVVC